MIYCDWSDIDNKCDLKVYLNEHNTICIHLKPNILNYGKIYIYEWEKCLDFLVQLKSDNILFPDKIIDEIYQNFNK